VPGARAQLNRDVVGRRPDDSPDSLSHLSWIGSLLKQCVDSHGDCRREAEASDNVKVETPRLPTRVIDITSDELFLKVTEGATGHYATLSYCWGVGKQARTLQSNLEDMQRGINLGSLPKTLQDAVAVARHLGIPFLWIDSLCIVQDNPLDWSQEASKMGQYYSNSFVTIAACSAEDVQEGFLHPRDSVRNSVKLPYRNRKGDIEGAFNAQAVPLSFYEGVTKSRWCTRGWVCQERFLSPRIIYFGKGRTFYECKRGETIAEDGELLDREGSHDDASEERQTPIMGILKSDPLRAWYHLLEVFSSCHLTYRSDRLPALRGVAQVMKDLLRQGHSSTPFQYRKPIEACDKVLKPEDMWNNNHWELVLPYHARGIWLGDLHRSLLWRIDENVVPKRSGTSDPSWSWASMETAIKMPELSIKSVPARQGLHLLEPIRTPVLCKPRKKNAGPQIYLGQSVEDCSRTLTRSLKAGLESCPSLVVEGSMKSVIWAPESGLNDQYERRMWEADRKVSDNRSRFHLIRDKWENSGKKDIVTIGWGCFEEDPGQSQVECLLVAVTPIATIGHLPGPNHVHWNFEGSGTSQSHFATGVLFLVLVPGAEGHYRRIGMGEIIQYGYWYDWKKCRRAITLV
jgi:hypothetical protein